MLNKKYHLQQPSYDKFDCKKRAKTVYLQPVNHNQLRMNKAISGFSKLSKKKK
jgi:hypothetical protein